MSLQILNVAGANDSLLASLCSFFGSLREEGDEEFFHPHPLTCNQARQLIEYSGSDEYYVAVDHEEVLAYGMLRGWDEGFDVPSLGLAVTPAERGSGIAALMMDFLRLAAKRRGATTLRLTVHRENDRAIRLFRQSGYKLEPLVDGRLVGYLRL